MMLSTMAGGRLTPQDKKDLDKFTKFLIYKAVQIIVQSRLGYKVKTQSKPFSSGSDWVLIYSSIIDDDDDDFPNEFFLHISEICS